MFMTLQWIRCVSTIITIITMSMMSIPMSIPSKYKDYDTNPGQKVKSSTETSVRKETKKVIGDVSNNVKTNGSQTGTPGAQTEDHAVPSDDSLIIIQDSYTQERPVGGSAVMSPKTPHQGHAQGQNRRVRNRRARNRRAGQRAGWKPPPRVGHYLKYPDHCIQPLHSLWRKNLRSLNCR